MARETGWSESFILDEIPMARALKYWHAAVWVNGAKTTKQAQVTPEKLAKIDDLLAQVVHYQSDETDF